MKLLPILVAITCGLTLKAQTPIMTNASLQSATIYHQGAALSHTAKVSLPSGSSEVVINNVAAVLDESSVQIGSSSAITVMSVRFATDYLKEENKSPAYLRVEAQAEAEKNTLQRIKNKKDVVENTLTLLDENRKIGGTETGLTVAELSKMTEYYSSRQLELKNSLIALTNQEKAQQKVVNKLKKQLKELANDRSGIGGQLVLQVMNNQAGIGEFHISYITPNAGWSPYYDLRAAGAEAPLKLMYKAHVTQTTGINWDHVQLTLSTGNPSQNGTAPVLSTWFLRYITPDIYRRRPIPASQKNLSRMETGSTADESRALTTSSQAIAPQDIGRHLDVRENRLSTSFHINLPYDIASNGRPHSVALETYRLPARYTYYAVPRLDPGAFLRATVTDFEQFNLIPGEANVIFDHMYVGKTYIDPQAATDSLNLSLGRDKKIVITRQQITDHTDTRLIGGSKKQTFTYEIVVHNMKSESVSLLLDDQFPVATNKDMEIKLLQTDGAEINEEKGLLRWKLRLAPGATEKVRISYSVKYPKDKKIGNL